MTDITTEDLLEVARGVFAWANLSERYGEKIVTRAGDFPNDNQQWEFNPLTSDADAWKVLEALVKKNLQICIYDWIGGNGDDDRWMEIENGIGKMGAANNLRTAIVKAYLSLVRG